MRYTFGTTDMAASRLKTIAEFFNPLSAQFIRQFIETPVDSVLDLGCGPGFTTNMLSNVTYASNTYGFDISDHFIKIAKNKFIKYNFLLHDVTQFPFPIKADIIYCRFLLSHLQNIVELINNWIGELPPGGILFIDELEDIHTNVKCFKKYLKISDGLVASQNATLFIGNLLAKGNYKGKILSNESSYLPVENYKAAIWFYPNTISIWEKESFVLESISLQERKHISSEILRIKESKDHKTDITWKMRRLVIQK